MICLLSGGVDDSSELTLPHRQASTKMPKEKKEVIKISLIKKGLNYSMELKCDPALEDFFKELSGGKVSTSGKWKDKEGKELNFYKATDKIKEFRSGLQERGIFCFDDFGSGLLSKDYNDINIAPLRIVGSSEGITMMTSDLINFEELKTYSNSLVKVVKNIYEQFIADCKLSAVVVYEI